jgi:hypothetical protein
MIIIAGGQSKTQNVKNNVIRVSEEHECRKDKSNGDRCMVDGRAKSRNGSSDHEKDYIKQEIEKKDQAICSQDHHHLICMYE